MRVTLADTAHRLASRSIPTVLTVELAEVVPPSGGQYAPCAWCDAPAALQVVLELVSADDDTPDPDPVAPAEVERQLCQRCTERLVPGALAGVARCAGRELSPPVHEALREGFAPLLRRLGASADLIASARFTVVAAPTTISVPSPR